MEQFDLTSYLSSGIENIVKNILRATLKDPRESAFMLKFGKASREASAKRAEYENAGEHSGGCVLFEKKESVEAILDNKENANG